MRRTSLLFPLLIAACWADFPESRFNRDQAAPKPERRDLAQTPEVGSDGPRAEGTAVDKALGENTVKDLAPDKVVSDKLPLDQPKTLDVKITCTANTFVACANSDKELRKCNATGDGVIVIVCGPSNKCDSALKRCTECTPGTTTCQGNDLATCSPDGLYATSTCPLGCKSGKCCLDADKDGVTSCATPPDCNDANADVFPGQTKFFFVPIPGTTSFDYDCSGSQEKQTPGPAANCVYHGSYCDGDGWESGSPACGQSGTWIACVKCSGGNCDENTSQKQQWCH